MILLNSKGVDLDAKCKIYDLKYRACFTKIYPFYI